MGETYPAVELAQWAEEWRQTRILTFDLLRVLPYAVLNFSPHPDFGTFARQLRHVGDVQFCYLRAIASGTMDLSVQPRQRALEQSKDALENYLRELDAELSAALQTLTAKQVARPVLWGSENLTLLQHLSRLLQHETLHHGMWAIYAKVADLPLPSSWRDAWAFRE